MARYHYVILSQARSGREEEYRRWYAEQHLRDVARQPGVVSARLFTPAVQKTYDVEVPAYTLMTMYELETADPAATMEAIRGLAGSAEMPMTDALDKAGMIQIVGTQIAAVDPGKERAMADTDPIGRMYRALSDGDMAAMRACFVVNARLWHCFDGIERSLDEACAGWARLIAGTASRGIENIVQRNAGDFLVQQHDFWMEALDGQRSAWHVCLVVRVEEGLIARIDEYIDRAGRFEPANLDAVS